MEPADLEQVGALLTERGEPDDAVDHRLVVSDPDAGPSSCAVVVDGDRVVSTAALLDEQVRVGRAGSAGRGDAARRPGRAGGHRHRLRGTRARPGPDGLGARAVGRARAPARGDGRDPVLLPAVRLRVRDGDPARAGAHRASPTRPAPARCDRRPGPTCRRSSACRTPPRPVPTSPSRTRRPRWRWLLARDGHDGLGASSATARWSPPDAPPTRTRACCWPRPPRSTATPPPTWWRRSPPPPATTPLAVQRRPGPVDDVCALAVRRAVGARRAVLRPAARPGRRARRAAPGAVGAARGDRPRPHRAATW